MQSIKELDGFVVLKDAPQQIIRPSELPGHFFEFTGERYGEALKDLENRYKPQFDLLRQAHLFPGIDNGERELNNPFSPDSVAPIVHNIGPHCVAVAYVAQSIARSLGLSPEQEKLVVIGGILHNLGKGVEVWAKVAARNGAKINPYAPDFLSCQATKNALKNAGYNDDLIEHIARTGADTGHNSLKSFLKLNEQGNLDINSDFNNPNDLVRAIVHIADDMVCSPKPVNDEQPKTYITTVANRMAASGFMNKDGYPFMYWSGLSFDWHGNVKDTGDFKPEEHILYEANGTWRSRVLPQLYSARYVDTYASLQVETTKMLVTKLCEHFKVEVNCDPEQHLLEKIVDQTQSPQRISLI